MKDIFDMTAGTSTGSIISAGLSYPLGDSPEDSQTPKYFAKEIIEIYTKNGDLIFSKSEGASNYEQGIIFILHVMIWGFVFYLVGRFYYDNPQVLKDFDKINAVISNKKKVMKRNTSVDDAGNAIEAGIQGIRNVFGGNVSKIGSRNAENETVGSAIELNERQLKPNNDS